MLARRRAVDFARLRLAARKPTGPGPVGLLAKENPGSGPEILGSRVPQRLRLRAPGVGGAGTIRPELGTETASAIRYGDQDAATSLAVGDLGFPTNHLLVSAWDTPSRAQTLHRVP